MIIGCDHGQIVFIDGKLKGTVQKSRIDNSESVFETLFDGKRCPRRFGDIHTDHLVGIIHTTSIDQYGLGLVGSIAVNMLYTLGYERIIGPIV